MGDCVKMNIFIVILGVWILYMIIQLAIDRSINTALLKENNKILNDIKSLLKEIHDKHD